MHKFNKIYYFIDEFNRKEFENLNKNISIIYRNYQTTHDYKIIKEIKEICRYQRRKFYISNNLKLALKLKLDGVYIPSFNNRINFVSCNIPNNFSIIGSAHNFKEIFIKQKQGCKLIFISPIFKTKKKNNFL